MKPTPAEIENGMSRSHSARMPPDRGERHVQEDQRGESRRTECHPQQEGDQGEGERHDDQQPRLGLAVVLELPAPFDLVARGQFQPFFERFLCRIDSRKQVALAHVELDDDAPRLLVATDLCRPRRERQIRDVAERHDLAGDCSERQSQQRREVAVEAVSGLDHDSETPISLEYRSLRRDRRRWSR